MKVVVTVECEFEVDVPTHNRDMAVRSVVEGWRSNWRHYAKWRKGTAPQAQGGRVVSARVAEEEP